MFKSNKPPALPPGTDWTRNLRETSFYRYGHLRSLGISGEITALAVDPVLSLLGVGTSAGVVHIFGQSAFQFALPISGPSSKPAAGIKFLTFHPGHHRIVVVDTANTLHSYTMQEISDHATPLTHPPLPTREASYTLWGTITAVDQPLPSHTHLFITMKDGQMLAWDLSRGVLGNWKIGNCWGEYEDKMLRSGMPGRRRTPGGPQATCLALNPRDLNVMLIGYEGGVVAWDFQKGVVTKNFEMFLPPGAPGGGSYQNNDAIWTERTPSVTSLAWRPDGQVFAVGHSDGCIALWAFSEPDKPLMVRTITHEDVNIADAESLYDAGALDTQPRKLDVDGNPVTPAVLANREPIYKLAWASFPDSASMKLLAAAQDGEPVTNATMDFAERGETILVILGGQSPNERPGVNLLQFPAYIPPVAPAKKTLATSESMPLQQRYAYRDSLMPTGASNYPTKTPPEDFVLLPRSNPYFGMAYDATALIVSLTPDKRLAPISASHGDRAMEAFVFPPQRSTVVPPALGRKTFVLPGEGENIVAMTPAPMMSPVARPGTPGTPGSTTPGWRLPWTSGSPLPSPRMRVATPNSIMSAAGRHRPQARRHYRIPSSIWTGHLSVLGCELVPLPTPAFKRLISWSIETASSETMPRLPLHGGLAVPDLQSPGAPDVKVAKLESYRILVTFHPDSTVRFWDTSPHLLILPTPLRFEYPGPLPHLTISIGEYLRSPDVAHLPLAQLWETDRPKVQIKSVHLAREALECIITMVTGEIIVTKFMEAKPGRADDEMEELDDEGGEALKSPNGGYFPSMPAVPSAVEGWVEEVTEIQHLARYAVDGFKPVAIFTLKQGEVVACAVSDIGFISVAFTSNSVAILDMRGPDVILREGFDEDGMVIKKKKRKNQNVQNVVGEQSLVGRLKWVVSGMGVDSTPRPRLIVSYSKGMTKIYTLVNVLGEWMVESKPPTFTNESLSGPLGTFVLDPTTGNELNPTAEALSSAMAHKPTTEGKKEKDVPPHCVWIAVSKKSIRAAVNFNGERVAKVEFVEEELGEAFYITRHGQKILVGITTTGSVLAYSLPFLQPITRMELYFGTQSRKIGRISIDDRSGDFIEYSGPLEINLRTLFHFRKPFPPRIDPCSFKRPVPAQPAPLGASGIPGAWLWGGAPLSGTQLDAIVAGPKRPPPPPPPLAPKKPLISWGEPPAEKKEVLSPTPVAAKRTTVAKVARGADAAKVRGERDDVYSEMRNATEERATYMDQLNDQLSSASVSAGNYLQQAKNNAMKEAAKSTVKGVFGKLM